MAKYVYDFAEGNRGMLDLLGGKGANLAEMSNLGLPVPPGFTITTEACREYLTTGGLPAGLGTEVEEHLSRLERTMGKHLGDPDDPLLVSVRSGARFSMPGMMDTVLDIGLNEASVMGLAKQADDERFAWDSYRRLVQMFGKTVMGADGALFEHALADMKRARGAASDLDLGVGDLRELVSTYKEIVKRETGREFPTEPREQLDAAIKAVFESWNTERARVYRRQERIPEDLGTAVNIVSMVFGNLGLSSGTGVAFTRDPATGNRGVYGDYLQDAQGEDVVAGIRNPVPLEALQELNEPVYRQLLDIMAVLEHHYRDLCDIEFTVENGRLWMLQTRVGKRTAAAAFRIATQLVDEGVISMDEALGRVNGAQLAELMFPRFAEGTAGAKLATGQGASPGAAVGKAVFDSEAAGEWASRGEAVILVRNETNPDDLPGMVAAKGILTRRGGRTSHAAVVARGLGKTCVVAAQDLQLDVPGRRFTAPDGTVIAEGDVISIDGKTGAVYKGAVEVAPSPLVEYFEGTFDAALADVETRDLVACVSRLLRHADARRRLGVKANADMPDDARRARSFGAEGIGLCRTEHMFLGERRLFVERLILAETEEERQAALDDLLPLQRSDFVQIFEQMDGLPVTIRLIDPPLHEFLPDLTQLSVRAATARAKGETDEEAERLLPAVRRLHEQNPMLGLRGVRLCLAVPGLIDLQVRAIAEAAVERKKAGANPVFEVMVPVVGAVQELEHVREEAESVIDAVSEGAGVHLEKVIGTMIELPRACLTAGQIATAADFFSYGTNDLTQTTWGFSRDDCEASFFPLYMSLGIFGTSPFETLDKDGVGALVRMGSAAARTAKPEIELGVCGEHGGDPESIHFFDEIGLDYVSCSPFRVPVARLEAGRAALPRSVAGKVSASR
ncbi:MAG: pyruvate, phosphate dikinase [Actinomycetota bacterium]|jgi:pyruvate,orthophosphate dikinase|nr:pyruvate, phosphate dikinase [Actinomycetota bacterium]